MGTPFSLSLAERDGSDDPWEKDGEKNYGETDGNERAILLNPNQTADQLHSTRLHEYVHAILHCAGLSSQLKEDLEESIAVAIEHGLAPLIKFR